MPVQNRPTGAPFWGETIALLDAVNISGNLLPYWDVLYARNAPATSPPYNQDSIVMHAGDKIQVWIEAAFSYLQPGDEGIRGVWTLEVLSGSGTLSLTDAVDPIANGTPYPTTNAVGTIPVTGVGTYTATAGPGATSDLLLATRGYIAGPTGYPTMLIECTAGEIELAQVKMRMWPPGGPLGSIGHQAAYDQTEQCITHHADPEGGVGHDEGRDAIPENDEPSWNAAHDQAMAAPAPEDNLFSRGSQSVVRAIYGETSYLYSGEGGNIFLATTVTLPAESLWLQRFTGREEAENPRPAGTERVDWIRLPTEVLGDPVCASTLDGPYTTEWINPVLRTLASGPRPEGWPASSGIFTIGATPVPPYSPTDFSLREYTTEGSSGTSVGCWNETDVDTPLSLPDATCVRITGRHEFRTTRPPVHGGGYSLFGAREVGHEAGGTVGSLINGDLVTPPRYALHFPTSTYWVPGNTPPTPDDTETRPLGFHAAPNPNLGGAPDLVDVNFGSW